MMSALSSPQVFSSRLPLVLLYRPQRAYFFLAARLALRARRFTSSSLNIVPRHFAEPQ
jgi:hypothetical protein